MPLDILYFAWVREHVGLSSERAELPADALTPLKVAQWLAARGGGYATAFAAPEKLRCALDQHVVAMTDPIGEAREIAFFPPVTGG